MAGEPLQRDALERLLLELGDPEFQDALEKIVTLVKNLNESGILDLLIALTDRDTIARITGILVNTGTMKLLDNLEQVSTITGEAASAMAEPVEPASLSQLIRNLADPEVARGLARIMQVLKAIGSV